MELQYEVRGLDEVLALLKEFPTKIESNVLQGTASAGGKVLTAAAIRAAPRSPDGKQSAASKKYGRLSDNIGFKKLKRVPPGSKQVRVGTRRSFWGYFIEKGTRYIAARPWFDAAVTSAIPAAVAKMRTYCIERSIREVNKLNQKYGVR